MDLATHIHQLLYTEDRVVVPGFGAFIATYKPTVIDHVQGLLHSPSKSLQFDELIKVDDKGVLQACLETALACGKEEAKERLQRYVNEVLAALARREIVVLPKVGRFYRDYENNLQFLQDSNNFNINSFGLPAVQFYPILRHLPESNTDAPLPKEKRVVLPKNRRAPQARRLTTLAMPAFVGVLVMALVATYFYVQQHPVTSTDEVHRLPVSESQLHQKPSNNEAGHLGKWPTKTARLEQIG